MLIPLQLKSWLSSSYSSYNIRFEVGPASSFPGTGNETTSPPKPLKRMTRRIFVAHNPVHPFCLAVLSFEVQPKTHYARRLTTTVWCLALPVIMIPVLEEEHTVQTLGITEDAPKHLGLLNTIVSYTKESNSRS